MDEIDFNGLVFSTTENESSEENEENEMGATFWEAQVMGFPTAVEL